MRVSKLVRKICGLCRETVVVDWEVTGETIGFGLRGCPARC